MSLESAEVAKRKPRLLFLCHTLPFPLDGGVWLRTYNVMRQLSCEFDIHAICFERAYAGGQDSQETATAVQALSNFGRVQVVQLPHERSYWAKIGQHIKSLFFCRVHTVFRYRTPEFVRLTHEALDCHAFDIVHLDSLDLSGILPLPTSVPVVCTHHNVESDLLWRRSRQERGLRSLYIRYQAMLQLREERRWCPSVTLNVTVSESDARRLGAIAPSSLSVVVPNGVDTEYFAEKPVGMGRTIVCVGGLNWFPNRDAMHHLANDILPSLRKLLEEVRVVWVGEPGNAADRDIARRAGIVLAGRVEDVRPFVYQAACFVVPIRVGGGSRLKILDAWSMGRAVVSTAVGCEGLDAVHEQNILIADDPKTFAELVASCLQDGQTAQRIGAAGRRAAAAYDWRSIGARMNSAYLDLLHAAVEPK